MCQSKSRFMWRIERKASHDLHEMAGKGRLVQAMRPFARRAAPGRRLPTAPLFRATPGFRSHGLSRGRNAQLPIAPLCRAAVPRALLRGAFQRTSSAFQPCCVTQPTPFRPPAFTKTFSARNKAATGAKQRGRIVMRMPRGRLRQRVSCGAVACACEYPPRRNPAQTARCGEASRGLAFSPALPPAARCQEGTPWLTSRAVSATWFSPTMP